MEARAAGRVRAPSGPPDAATVIVVGAVAGLIAGMMMALYQMIVGAIATEPTAVPGIGSSFWTAVTSIPSVLFGMQWFHGGFEFWAVLFGLIGHMMNSIVIGIVGVWISTRILGSYPSPAAAVFVGVMFALVVEVVLVNIVINGILQTVDTFYTSTPEWSWWVAHAIFGMILGLVASVILRQTAAPARAR